MIEAWFETPTGFVLDGKVEAILKEMEKILGVYMGRYTLGPYPPASNAVTKIVGKKIYDPTKKKRG